ncbi:MAG: [protein-PII] uridylyltransferase [Acidobacteriota bacterium]
MRSLAEKNLTLSFDGLSPAGLKRFLKIETERLRIRHRLSAGGREIASRRSRLVDFMISRACQIASPSTEGFAVVALGGYGRGELAPFSDIDLLFLVGARHSDEAKKLFEQILYLLWDTGLVIGHSLRTVSQCVTMARNDLHTRTALSTARLLAGDEKLFAKLVNGLQRKAFLDRRDNERFIEAINAETESRYEKFGRAVCLQEPNVKESAGGLRDLHTIEWVGHELFGARSIEDLRDGSFISDAECAVARRAYDFIARVRNESHFATGRKTDLITLDLQPQMAANLGYKDGRGLMASEIFMRDYYQRASELHRFCEGFLARAAGAGAGKRSSTTRAKHLPSGFELREGRLHLGEKRDFDDPAQIINAFSAAQSEAARLSDDLKLAIEKRLKIVSRSFRASAEAGRALMEILGRGGRVGRAMRMMHETGFLSRLLPEFARITFLVQHDFYHRYTIDEHTLRAVESLDLIATADDAKTARLRAAFDEIENPAALYLGLLLHDIGKGRGGGHVQRGVYIAERVCKRLKLDDETSSDVAFLVEHHLVMSHLAARRDLSEESLIEEFSAKVVTLQRLNMLLLLTCADASAVAPGVWNDWKAGLVWELYTRARKKLTHTPSALDADRVTLLKQRVMRSLLPDFLPSEVERHFAMLPERYARAYDAERIARHIRLIHRMRDESMVVEWQSLEDRHCTELVVCAKDREGLFARIAGTLTACGVNILSADLSTREDGIALDTFRLSQTVTHHPVRREHWSRIEKKLTAALEVSDVAREVEAWMAKHARRKPNQPARVGVRFDSDSSSVSTIIEVKAGDEPGLAFRIAGALAALRINISFASITTEKNRALDIFYVDSRGRKLSGEEIAEAERAIVEALAKK